MLKNPSRVLARALALAASVALVHGFTATPVRAADPDPTPTPDFRVVAAWPRITTDIDTGEKIETDFALVTDSNGVHRFDGSGWSWAHLPDLGACNLQFGRVSSDGVVVVSCPSMIGRYSIETDAVVAGTVPIPADATDISANASVVVYRTGGSWYSRTYGADAATELAPVGQPVSIIAGASDGDDVEGRSRATIVEALTRECEDGAGCTTETIAIDLSNDNTELTQSFSDIEAVETFDAAGPMGLFRVRYPAAGSDPAADFLYVRMLDAEGVWAAAQDDTDGVVASVSPRGVLTGSDGVLRWFNLTDDGGALGFAAPTVLNAGEYTDLSFVSNQPTGTPIARFTDAAGVVGLAKIVYDEASGAGLAEITHLQVEGSAVTISGPAQVGQTLSATASGWTPSAAQLSYQWLAEGVEIDGATSSTYALTGAELGKKISVRVTGALAGYETAVKTSAQTDPVADVVPGSVSISGTAAVGQLLTATTTGWPAGASLSYQWLRGSAVVGTQATYTVTSADAGSQLSVRVTGTLPGHTDLVATSAPVSVPAAGKQLTATPRPVILGSARTGRTLIAVAGLWRPVPVKLGYQWYRDGVAIRGATKITYRVAKADRGSRLTVAVTGSKTGYVSVTRVSQPTSRVR